MNEHASDVLIAELRALEPNWDGNGAPRISRAVLKIAHEILIGLESDGTSRVIPSSDGGVEIRWTAYGDGRFGGVSLSIEVNP